MSAASKTSSMRITDVIGRRPYDPAHYQARFREVHPRYYYYRFRKLAGTLQRANPQFPIGDFWAAAALAAHVHRNDTRIAGGRYLIHPYRATAIAVYERNFHDPVCVLALPLHDVVEHSEEIDVAYLHEKLGLDVARTVSGVTKLERATADATAAMTYRRLIEVMSTDLRSMVAKLFDRTDNMRHLSALRAAKRRRISLETQQVYLPAAEILGIRSIRDALRDLSFRWLSPSDFRRTRDHVDLHRAANLKAFGPAVASLERSLAKKIQVPEDQGRKPWVFVRRSPLTYYDHFLFAQGEGGLPVEAAKVHSIQVVVPREDDCYVAHGILNRLFPPYPGSFQDLIAESKPNLHSGLRVVNRVKKKGAVRVEILTREMLRVNTDGILALPREEWQLQWRPYLAQLLEEVAVLEEGDRVGLIEVMQRQSQRVVVYDRDEEECELRRGATALDFAYYIHPGVGLRAVGARINGVRLEGDWRGYVLRGGESVEILTESGARPTLSDYEHVDTPAARNGIRDYFSNLSQAEIQRVVGKALDQALGQYFFAHGDIRNQSFLWAGRFPRILNGLTTNMEIRNEEDLLRAVTLGFVTPEDFAAAFRNFYNTASRDRMRRIKRKGAPDRVEIAIVVPASDELMPGILESFSRAGLTVHTHQQGDPVELGEMRGNLHLLTVTNLPDDTHMARITMGLEISSLIRLRQIDRIMKSVVFPHRVGFNRRGLAEITYIKGSSGEERKTPV